MGPQLVAIETDPTAVLTSAQLLHAAPTELDFKFDSNIDLTTLVKNNVASIQVTRGGDHTLGNGNDVSVAAGYLGVGEQPNQLIFRFASALPDDVYQITIVGSGSSPLKGSNGMAFNGGADFTQTFTVDTGPTVVAVVPQPITRTAGGALQSQSTNEVDVYFNTQDPLDPNSAINKTFYELIRTSGPAPSQNILFNPTSVSYSSSTGLAVLTFDPSVLSVAATYRLRIGNNDALTAAPITISSSGAGSSFSTSQDLGAPFTLHRERRA